MSTHREPTLHTVSPQLNSQPHQLRNALSEHEKTDEAVAVKARICRRVVMRLGDRYSSSQLAELAHVPKEQVSRWSSSRSRVAPTLMNMLDLPDDVLDEMLSRLALERAKRGHATRRWTEASDERTADRTPQLTAALERVAQANADLTAIVAEMRGSRG